MIIPTANQIVAIAFCLFVCSLFSAQNSYADDAIKACDQMSIFAGQVMTARQSGTAKSQLLAPLEQTAKENNFNKKITELMRAIVDIGYDYPIYSSETNKKNSIVEFKSLCYQACMQQFGR